MTIYFVETEQGERGFFEEALKGHALRFVSCLDEVDADAELLSIFIRSRIGRRFLDQHPNIKLTTTRSTVNTARGRLIDTDALIEALDNGAVGGAGLDVIEEERVMQRKWSSVAAQEIIDHLHANAAREEPPIKDSGRVQTYHALMHNAEIIARPNVVFTPHIAFNSVQAVERINRTTVEPINAFLAGKPVNVLKESVESRPTAMSSTTGEDWAAGRIVLSQK